MQVDGKRYGEQLVTKAIKLKRLLSGNERRCAVCDVRCARCSQERRVWTGSGSPNSNQNDDQERTKKVCAIEMIVMRKENGGYRWRRREIQVQGAFRQ